MMRGDSRRPGGGVTRMFVSLFRKRALPRSVVLLFWGSFCLPLFALAACTKDNPYHLADAGQQQPGDATVFFEGGSMSDAAAPGDHGSSKDWSEVTQPEGGGPSPDGAGADTKPGPVPCPHPETFYADSDGDGYGDPAKKIEACVQPDGYVANSLDCDDADAQAHPGQQSYFVTPTKGTNNFDYNCNEIEEKEHTQKVSCSWVGPGCTGDGWAMVVPACGQSGSFIKCVKAAGNFCSQVPSMKVQACR